MSEYLLSINPGGVEFYRPGIHNTSAVIFEDRELVFGVEEERFTREKHGYDAFPAESIRACLDFCDVSLPDVDAVVLPWDLRLETKLFGTHLKQAVALPDHVLSKLFRAERTLERHVFQRTIATKFVRGRLANIGTPVPPIEARAHHACHAASAFYPSGFDEALVLTIDGLGEYDSTVVWTGDSTGVERVRTYEYPNSLGHFYRAVTAYLGYPLSSRSEGKIMGLAPYGEHNPDVEAALLDLIDVGVDYDVRPLTGYGVSAAVDRLEDVFDRPTKARAEDFSQWEKDLAYTTQHLLEETVVDIVEAYRAEYDRSNVALAGGVALNCKMNKRVMEAEGVEDVFVQPVAHDGGITVGAGMLEYRPTETPTMTDAYLGPAYDSEGIKAQLETNKIDYEEPADLPREVAERIADGAIVGWFQGRMEMGPRALGNRSILADPRTAESRDNVNHFVKHREAWRPFAPSMLEEAVEEYLLEAEPAPFMIKTFDTRPDKKEDMEAVIHPGDGTTRPQTVNEEQNPRYYRLIKEFEDVTGVPILLNTSFNDHGEPIVNRPVEAIRDFFAMGMDVLALEDVLVEK